MSERILRLPEAEARSGLKKSAIYALIQRGEFPRPIPLTDSEHAPRGWLESEIADWIGSRIAKARGSREVA